MPPEPTPSPAAAGPWDAPAPALLTRRRLLIAAAGGAIPAGAAAAAVARVEPLAILSAVRLPPPPLLLAMARVALPPGVETAATTVAGARLIVAERGMLTVRLAGPGLPPVGPAPVGQLVAGPEGTFRLREGQALGLPARAVEGMGNDRAETVVALDAAVFPSAPPRPRSFVAGDGTDVRMLGLVALDRAPDEPVDFLLRRVALPAGTALPPQLGEGIALLWVEEGRAAIDIAAGSALLSIVAGPVGPTGSPRRAETGDAAFLPAGSSAAVGLGAAVRVSATPAAPAGLLLATIHPATKMGRRPAPNDDPGARRDRPAGHDVGGIDGWD